MLTPRSDEGSNLLPGTRANRDTIHGSRIFGEPRRGLRMESVPVINARNWTELLNKPDPGAGGGSLFIYFLFPYIDNDTHTVVNRSH